MKVIKRDLGQNYKSIKLLALSDFHIGDKLCDLKKIKELLNEIKESEDIFVILNGDLINNSTASSVGDTYEEEITPNQQMNELCTLLEPIKEKILCIASGNHEARTKKEVGIDLIEQVAYRLGIEDRYANGWWYLYLTLGLNEKKKDRPIMYTITGTHGYGGGRKNGGKINNLVEMSDKVVADLYIMGHTHTPIVTRNSIFVPDYQHKTLIQKDKYYLMTNAFLKYGGYGERYGFTPSTTDIQEAILDGTKKKIKIIV